MPRPTTPTPEELSWELVEDTDDALNGLARRRQVAIQLGGGRILHLLIYLPQGSEPTPAFLGLNFHGNHTVTDEPEVLVPGGWVPDTDWTEANAAGESGRGAAAQRWSIQQTVARGYAVATAYHGDLEPDLDRDGDGIRALHPPAGPGDWGAVAAWAWGLSRALDVLQSIPEIDPTRVAVMGHSRNGKAALLAAALDQRFALAVSNQSGCTGAALSRRHKGETVLFINELFPHWFCEHYEAFNDREDHLPVDQHLLIAMVAPRPVLVVSGEEDHWADPEGEFGGAAGATPVYELLGAAGLDTAWPTPLGETVGGPLAYHLKSGGHQIGPEEWTVFCDFADLWL